MQFATVVLALAATVVAQQQAPDGQPQVVSQIHDGQLQAPTAVVTPAVKQITDGQIQAPTAAPAPAPVVTPAVKQISDGQIQAPTSVPAPVKQISDGQIQAPTNGSVVATPTPSAFVGAAPLVSFSGVAMVGAGVAAAFALL